MKNVYSKVLLLTLLIFSLSVKSTNYYVTTSGSDSNAGTFLSESLASVTKAVSKASAGDTIYVRSGTYTLTSRITISKSGTSASKYYLFVYPGDARPILDFSGMSIGSSNQGVLLSSANYWYIKGIRIKGAGDNGMQINSGGNNRIEFCDFYENRDAGLQLKNGTVNNQIINCDAYYNADYVSGSTSYTGGNADGFAPKLDIGSGNYFYGCRSWLNSDDGWDGLLYADYNINTTLENCWTWKNGYLSDGTTTTSDMNGNGFKMGGGWTTDSGGTKHYTFRHNMTLINCMAFMNKGKGFDQNHNYGAMTIYNGTAYKNGGYNYYINDSVSKADTVKVINCLYYAGSYSYAISSSKNIVVSETNSWNLRAATSSDFQSVDTTGISGARQSDGSLPEVSFMHLASGSSFINAGTNVGVSYNGTAPDLGCFETSDVSGINESTYSSLQIGPIPAQDYLKLMNVDETCQITIVNLRGEIVQSQTLSVGESVYVGFLPSGVYLIQAVTDTQKYRGKIVKQ